jgi:predicted nuclease with RNAse H fold
MSHGYAVGIDVGGVKKGFHVAVLDLGSGKWVEVKKYRDAFDLARSVAELGAVQVVAIDAPPRSLRGRVDTREAERAVCGLGFRVQWTRRSPMAPPEWMVNGENLWLTLTETLPQVQKIEVFPTMVSDILDRCELTFPLKMLQGGVSERGEYRDVIDACLAAWVGQRYVRGEAVAYGVDDEFGPIWR